MEYLLLKDRTVEVNLNTLSGKDVDNALTRLDASGYYWRAADKKGFWYVRYVPRAATTTIHHDKVPNEVKLVEMLST